MILRIELRRKVAIVGILAATLVLPFFLLPVLAAQYPPNYSGCVSASNCLPTYKYLSLSCAVFGFGAEYYRNGEYVPVSDCFECIVHSPAGCLAYDRL